MDKKWYEMNESELERELDTSTVNGLTRKSVSKRLKDGANTVFRLPHGSFSSYFKDILSDSSSLILIIAALIAGVFENTVTAYVISAIILVNCIIAVFTYVKAHRVLESMGDYSLPGVRVVRDGHLYLANMTSLVPGDLIYIKAGDIVPADARIIVAENFFVSEKGITGNVSAIRKSPQNVSPENKSNESMFNMVFATSVVLKGTAKAIVVETGENTLVSRTEGNNLEFDHDNLDIFVMLKKYASKLSLLMLLFVFVIMFLEIAFGLKDRGLYEIFLGGMSLAVAAMTEFYTAFGYIIVACGLFSARSDRNSGGVILKNISSLEKLRDINCVIFNKNGILSEKKRIVDSFFAGGQLYRVNDHDSASDGFEDILEAAVVTTGNYTSASLTSGADGNFTPNPDEEAIIACADRYGLYNIGLEKKYPIIVHVRAGKRSAYDFTATEKNGGVRAYIRGYAKTVLNACAEYSIGSTLIPLDRKMRLKLLSVIGEYEKANTSVYAIAVRDTDRESLMKGPNIVCRDRLVLLGFIALKAPLFEGSAITVDKLVNAGIKPVLNSPDALDEDIESARSLGILKSDKDILTESIMEKMSDEILRATVHTYSVYFGLKNSSIRKVLGILKENGYNVGFCADKLSDISVMECADIGYAHADLPGKGRKQRDPGSESSDALRFKADIVIPNDSGKNGGIRAIEDSILTAKLIYKNIMNMLGYLVNVQFARLFIVLYSVFTRNNILSPVQILIGGLAFDFLAILTIAFTKPGVHTLSDYAAARREQKNLPKFIMRNALFGVFWAVMTIFIPRIVSAISKGTDSGMLMSTAFISFSLLQLIILTEVKRPDSIFKPSSFNINPVYIMTCIFVVTVLVTGLFISEIGNIIGLLLPSAEVIVSALIIVVAVTALHEIYKALINKSENESTN